MRQFAYKQAKLTPTVNDAFFRQKLYVKYST